MMVILLLEIIRSPPHRSVDLNSFIKLTNGEKTKTLTETQGQHLGSPPNLPESKIIILHEQPNQEKRHQFLGLEVVLEITHFWYRLG
jgi:hypothetical protein